MNWIFHFSQRESDQDFSIYIIHASRRNWLDQKINNLNKVAQKLGLPPVGYHILREFTEDDSSDSTGMKQIPRIEIELFGKSPQVTTPSGNSYKFISRIMHTEEGNILKTIPGVELPPKFRTIEPRCEHCNYKRKRKDTFLLENVDTGSYVQVGSTCIKDFLGHQSANMYASWAESLADLDLSLSLEEGNEDSGFGTVNTYDIERFLELVYGYIKMFGWTGRSTARETGGTASVDGALSLYYSKEPKDQEIYKQMIKGVSANDKEMLKSALEWSRELKESEDTNKLSDYLWNLSISCSSPVVYPQTMGIVGSLPIAYNKSVISNIVPNSSTTAGRKGDLYIGRGVLEDESLYGSESAYRMRTDENKLIQWSGDSLEQTVGSVLHIEGVIVGYSRFFSNVTTRLARVRVLSSEEYEEKRQSTNTVQDFGDKPDYVPGQRVTVDVTILDVRDMEGNWGRTTLYTMIDRWNNTIKWFSSSKSSFETGERLKITGTVKKLAEYKGKPEIHLTRVKVDSREVPKGIQDNRLSLSEDKALKKQLGILGRKIKKIQKSTGIIDDQDLNHQILSVLSPLSNVLNSIRDSISMNPETKILWNPGELLENYESLGLKLQQWIDAAVLAFSDRIRSLESQDYDNSYQINILNRNISLLKNTNLHEILNKFIPIVQEFIPRKHLYDQSKPEMDRLLEQINNIEEKRYQHRLDVKKYGPKTSSFNWLSKIITGTTL